MEEHSILLDLPFQDVVFEHSSEFYDDILHQLGNDDGSEVLGKTEEVCLEEEKTPVQATESRKKEKRKRGRPRGTGNKRNKRTAANKRERLRFRGLVRWFVTVLDNAPVGIITILSARITG